MRRIIFLPLYLAIFAALLWSWQVAARPTPAGEPVVEMWVLNVGQGESILIREPSGKKILFDGGPNDSVLSELGAILPIWDRTIDLVILSHNHADHIRGLISVFERYTVKAVWISGATHTTADFRAFQESVVQENITPTLVKNGYETDIGALHLRTLYPTSDVVGTSPTEQHDATIAVEVQFGTQDMLLTGDLNDQHEVDLLEACPPPLCSLEAEVLQVPHHGSASGLREDFLQAIQPQLAVIPVGLDNKFDHPRQIILDRLNAFNIPIYRTDLQGRIHLTIRKSGISVVTGQSAPLSRP